MPDGQLELNAGERILGRWRAAAKNLPSVLGPWAYLNFGDLVLTSERLFFSRMLGDAAGVHVELQTGVPISFSAVFTGDQDVIPIADIASVEPRGSAYFDMIDRAGRETRFMMSQQGVSAGPWSKKTQKLRDDLVDQMRKALATAG